MLVILISLALIVFYLGFVMASELHLALIMLLLGGLLLWIVNRIRVLTNTSLVLTDRDLRTGDGLLVADLENMKRVERGLFAFRPSGGFLLVLSHPVPFSWRPGLLYCIGRYVGIGGMTSKAQSKRMAEALTAMLLRREKSDL